MRERDIPFKRQGRQGHIVDGRVFVELGKDFKIGNEEDALPDLISFWEQSVLGQRRINRQIRKGK